MQYNRKMLGSWTIFMIGIYFNSDFVILKGPTNKFWCEYMNMETFTIEFSKQILYCYHFLKYDR